MIFYPPTTLLPFSPPYSSLDDIIITLCDRCLMLSDSDGTSQIDIDQFYEVTMAIVDFWFHEIEGKTFRVS